MSSGNGPGIVKRDYRFGIDNNENTSKVDILLMLWDKQFLFAVCILLIDNI